MTKVTKTTDKKKTKITKMTRMGGAIKCPGNEVDCKYKGTYECNRVQFPLKMWFTVFLMIRVTGKLP